MANAAYEQVLEAAKTLSPEERQRLMRELATTPQQETQPVKSAAPATHQREREMHWLAEHEGEYAGQWLALDEDRLVSHGSAPYQVEAAALAAGAPTPFVVFAEDPQEVYFGGWQ